MTSVDTSPAVDSAPEPLAAEQPRDTGSQIYSGEIVAVDQVLVVAQVAGTVRETLVDVGDRVTAGEILLSIHTTALEAQRAHALAGLEAAQAQLELLRLPPDEAAIEAARAAVTAADAAYKRAVEGPTPAQVAAAEAKLRRAEADLVRAQAAYEQLAWNPLLATLPETLQLEQAQQALEQAQTQLEELRQQAGAEEIAAAYARLAEERAHLRSIEDGPDPAQIQAAEAQVHQAETALYLAQLTLDNATVRAPISGLVAHMNASAGTTVAPGDPLARIVSSEVQLVVRVDESRVSSLKSGQSVSLQVGAYPGEVFAGEIASIAPEVDPVTRSAAVTIRPIDDGARLRPGMLATVDLLPLPQVDDTMQLLTEPPSARSPAELIQP